MSSFKTRRELVLQALANLFVTSAGQAPADDDFAGCDSYVDGVLAQLEQREIIRIDDPDRIPVAYFHLVAICLADAAKDEFGGQALDVAAAEQKLRTMSRSGPTYETLRTEYF